MFSAALSLTKNCLPLIKSKIFTFRYLCGSREKVLNKASLLLDCLDIGYSASIGCANKDATETAYSLADSVKDCALRRLAFKRKAAAIPIALSFFSELICPKGSVIESIPKSKTENDSNPDYYINSAGKITSALLLLALAKPKLGDRFASALKIRIK